jgi:hypothetical protein
MRVKHAVSALAAATVCLAISACSRPDVAGPAQASRPAAPQAQPQLSMSSAEKLYRLDIMLMVTSLRCRKTSNDFTADYQRFNARQLAALNEAATKLRGRLGGKAAFDRVSTGMANSYGNGHPWLNCGQLKQVTRNLAQVQGKATLAEAADQLLARKGSPRLALGKR